MASAQAEMESLAGWKRVRSPGHGHSPIDICFLTEGFTCGPELEIDAAGERSASAQCRAQGEAKGVHLTVWARRFGPRLARFVLDFEGGKWG